MSTKVLRKVPRTVLRRQAGVTLIELVMFIVIVGVALAGIVAVMSFTTANSTDPLRRKQALMIAESLLEEVRLAGFTFCDPRSENADSAQSTPECTLREAFGNEAPALRPFDNVNDYVAASNTPASPFNDGSGALVDALGRRLDLAGYNATVTITPDRLGDIAAAGAAAGADADVLRIRVTVTFEGGDPVLLDGYRTRYAPVPRFE